MSLVGRAAKNAYLAVLRTGQRCGFDLLPRHFYSSIPDINQLRERHDWRKPRSMVGVPGKEIETQLTFVAECCPPPLRERLRCKDIFDYACRENKVVGFGATEADFLFCFMASKRPRRVVQVGAGVSTAVMLLAARESGHHAEFACIDPYPTAFLQRASAAAEIKLIPQPAQQVDITTLTDLESGDLLFIDSTHAVRVGSEVNLLVLEVLPRLKPGVWVHFHDIYFPYDYHRSVFTEPFFPSESTLLHAFLACNSRFALRASLSMLHYAAPKALSELLPNYAPTQNNDGLDVPHSTGHFPSSAYLQAV
ncbi:MAG TPA: class I SAM-dependent methyltransferase [Verrucomicrobiae bacterium]